LKGESIMKMTNNQTTISGMRVKSSIKAGGKVINHNQTVRTGLRVKSSIKAGLGICGGSRACPFGDPNHNQTVRKPVRTKCSA
jgi:hypothetical protein